MKTINLLILFLFINYFSANAQQYLQDIQGNVITEQSVTDVIGTPFFNNEFTNGTVILTNGSKYENVPLKYNSHKDELFFKNPKDGSLLSFVIPVKSFDLLGQTYVNGFPSIDKFTENSYYGVLTDGKTKLLFKNYKTITENKEYNSAITEKRYEENKTYYVFRDDKMIRIKPSKKDLLETLSDKSKEMDAFLKRENIDFKNSADLAKVFEYYSSL